ncbi:MAG: 16S rRNA (guanine(527)-N(7))-methyltransferase RsmG [Yaniella sp.]|uniref:16S rRNA (guanine(527)-N(7))-methyltransferase RsmG n=1 Tax=Yaniella sp. TaxID=2773929 RepID=UPI00264868CC|nr:16S rRNA (guanine(527)-N(7))-methyltransferase RsmG [Yaniella sp.]MDN5730706.1 16S rRNA (guanine(527)-N(7))-methyltransferase RsmG [Yaniella sp.]MDN5815672.1 16S rRNA (guanine(527)-N(7))-methyltransferase RsmG [Yaniella sp.]MDN5817807.1 16S rRNA (guanine(527)-N(7))-methyltransferase RsmG [Yaniella sp.]MDN5838850.1 16S rRNA (guanine(527)-N(7))-methyltransferase RsmG [Yaniella sp.]MDN5889398.1 16S rRNA (guanine(527)-N(7))-methyltransferase RsmG [Yaniella sp.]
MLYGDRTDVAERFVHHLVTTGIEWGLLGPREIPKMWDRHVLNCAVVQELLPKGALVADVGSGAGLPGIALAIARPDVQFVLIEPLERRVDWLEMVIADLELENVDVVRARSEQVFETVDVDIVTARAVSAMKSLVPMTVPLLHGTGELLAIKGKSAANEIEKADKVLRKFKTKNSEVLTVGDELLAVATTVVRLTYGS